MKKVFSIVLLSLLAGCSSSTGGNEDDYCPPDYTRSECEDYQYWQEYYKEHPEQVEEDLKYYFDLE